MMTCQASGPDSTTSSAAEPDEGAFLRALGKKVRIQRVVAELSQRQLAERARLSRNFVSSIERGLHSVGILHVVHLAVALDVGLEDLMPPIELIDTGGRPGSCDLRGDLPAETPGAGATGPPEVPM